MNVLAHSMKCINIYDPQMFYCSAYKNSVQCTKSIIVRAF